MAETAVETKRNRRTRITAVHDRLSAPAGASSGRSQGMDEPVDQWNPRRPEVRVRLSQRTPSGGYVVADADLVRGIRGADARGDIDAARMLSEVLVTRCLPEFQRRTWGLRHRPELMEDAIAGMVEQLLREARDPAETFMTQNFIHYLRCLCADNFNRVLRQEGLAYRRDAEGRPLGRPQHVPRALVESIDPGVEDASGAEMPSGAVSDPTDAYEERMASIEAQRILGFLPDPLDRQIVILRALEGMRWDDIAALCGKTERTMRMRFEKARQRLRERVEAEAAGVY
jgi:DNA-directed RNA polymerase specialized sigma24 family protein